jgi:hypothetical protein
MTKKLAFFVEGQTERIFVQRLITEIAGEYHVKFDIYARSNGVVTFSSIEAPRGAKYAVLLFDCGSDGAVKSAIIDRWDRLSAAGYELVIGLRDLYPLPIAKAEETEAVLQIGLPGGPPEARIYLSVAEVEAWFLQERTHYVRVDSGLGLIDFRSNFAFDPETDSAELVNDPAQLLKQIYQSVRKTYKKKRMHVQRTVDALDYAELIYGCSDKIPRFGLLSARLNDFFG